ncbi:hypothetical protein LCGC14_2035700, partial [marine sediment metagenome]
MTRRMWIAALVAGLSAWPAPATAADDIVLTVELKLKAKADLSARDIKTAHFPGGADTAFTYAGTPDPKLIGFYQQLGFRTTVGVSPRAKAAHIKALEDAGAEIGVGSIWGAKASYISVIGTSTYQRAYDAALSSRRVIQGMARGPAHLINASSSKAGNAFMYDRRMDCGIRGYGQVFQDANFMVNWGWREGYPILLARGTTAKVRMLMPKYRMGGMVSAELIYFQSLANQIRGTLRREDKGKAVTFPLPEELPATSRRTFTRIVGKFGKDPAIWHATVGEVTGLAYLKSKSRVTAVTAAGGESLRIALALDRDIHVPFLLAALPLELPGTLQVATATINGAACPVTVRDGRTFLDVPVRSALTAGVEMTLETERPD